MNHQPRHHTPNSQLDSYFQIKKFARLPFMLFFAFSLSTSANEAKPLDAPVIQQTTQVSIAPRVSKPIKPSVAPLVNQAIKNTTPIASPQAAQTHAPVKAPTASNIEHDLSDTLPIAPVISTRPAIKSKSNLPSELEIRPAHFPHSPTTPPYDPKHQYHPKIQLAILLDTSGSMDGLINQTRNQLWQIVNEFTSAKKQGLTPTLEVALFEYGNDGNPASHGYVRMLNRFTRELDKVSEGLFSLTTNGGSEYCGVAIKTAVTSLNWSRSHHDIKTIFIAGNEPFTQGPVHYQDAIAFAKQHGISVNTIFAGNHNEGIQTGWQTGALLAGGDYMSINANHQIIHLIAPQDERIAQLNAQLNRTYVPYGHEGAAKHRRQEVQDTESKSISAGLLAKRAQAKASSFYDNSSWDLVDAVTQGEISEEQVAEMEADVLPAPMQKMDKDEKKQYIAEKSEERKKIQKEIATLSKEREIYIAAERKKQAASAPVMGEALIKALKKEAKKKQFTFEKEN